VPDIAFNPDGFTAGQFGRQAMKLILTFVLLMTCIISSAADLKVASYPPFRADINGMVVATLRADRGIREYRAVVDGIVVGSDKTRNSDPMTEVAFAVDPYTHRIFLRFSEKENGGLFPSFNGIENQCSSMEHFIPDEQTLVLNDWVVIFRETIQDHCSRTKKILEVQIR
jgi:hypothetical protein